MLCCGVQVDIEGFEYDVLGAMQETDLLPNQVGLNVAEKGYQ
jgi:hypothetical protein